MTEQELVASYSEIRKRLRNPPRRAIPVTDPPAPILSKIAEVDELIGFHNAELEKLYKQRQEICGVGRIVTIRRIQELAASEFGFSVIDLLSPRKFGALIEIRHLAIYAARKLTLMSLGQIGARFGDRDHSTVIHAVRKTESRMTKSPMFSEKVSKFLERCAQNQ